MTAAGQIVIIDYDVGNIDSVKRAVEYCGGRVILSRAAEDLETCSHIILPGVGSFDAVYDRFAATGLIPVLAEQVNRGVPLLGICVGMQLLASYGEEGKGSEGLNLIPGRVVPVKTHGDFRLPHIGWNSVFFDGEEPLFDGIPAEKDFYFVHSYHFQCESEEDRIATVDYSEKITAAVRRENIMGVQFHPEKSQKVGAALLKNFIQL